MVKHSFDCVRLLRWRQSSVTVFCSFVFLCGTWHSDPICVDGVFCFGWLAAACPDDDCSSKKVRHNKYMNSPTFGSMPPPEPSSKKFNTRNIFFGVALLAGAVILLGLLILTAPQDPADDPAELSEPPVPVTGFESSKTSVPEISDPENLPPSTTISSINETIEPMIPSPGSTNPSAVTVPTQPGTPPAVDDAPLSAGSKGPRVLALQQQLNRVLGLGIDEDGVFGDETKAAVVEFQKLVGLEQDGATSLTLEQLVRSMSPAFNPTAAVKPCNVALVGDSLVDTVESYYFDAFDSRDCDSVISGVGSRTLTYGWVCGFTLRDSPGEGCRPSGLTQVQQWSADGTLSDRVIISALGTNDALVFSADQIKEHFEELQKYADASQIILVSPQVKPGSDAASKINRYNITSTAWCTLQLNCTVADWAASIDAANISYYADDFHLTGSGYEARAEFIADIALKVSQRRPVG